MKRTPRASAGSGRRAGAAESTTVAASRLTAGDSSGAPRDAVDVERRIDEMPEQRPHQARRALVPGWPEARDELRLAGQPAPERPVEPFEPRVERAGDVGGRNVRSDDDVPGALRAEPVEVVLVLEGLAQATEDRHQGHVDDEVRIVRRRLGEPCLADLGGAEAERAGGDRLLRVLPFRLDD